MDATLLIGGDTFPTDLVVADPDYRHQPATEPFYGLSLALFFMRVDTFAKLASLAAEPGLIPAILFLLINQQKGLRTLREMFHYITILRPISIDQLLVGHIRQR